MDKRTFQLAAGIPEVVADRWWPHVEAALFEFGILRPQRVAAWIAQVGHESRGFTVLVESFDYRIDALRGQFSRITPAMAAKLGRQPGERAVPLERQQRIASIAYANRYGNGDAATGDGWRYRGRGLKQITFFDNYLECGQALGVDLIAQPDRLASDDGLAARSAAWFWYARGCSQLADTGDIGALTRRINGGLNGIEDRTERWRQAKRVLLA